MQVQKINAVWATDIHIDHLAFEDDDAVEGKVAILEERIKVFADKVMELNPKCLILTGDIDLAKPIEGYANLGVIETVKKIQKLIDCPIYFVLGNHDFWEGSFNELRNACQTLTLEKDHCLYLHKRWIELNETTALVGADGWYDGQAGDLLNSNFLIRDFHYIDDLKVEDDLKIFTEQMKEKLIQIANESANYVKETLPEVFKKYQNAILATHVPPFHEVSYHEGKIASDQSAPFFVSKVMGDALLEVMAKHPNNQLTVIAGHSHDAKEYRPEGLKNLHVIVGGAEYGAPKPQGVL